MARVWALFCPQSELQTSASVARLRTLLCREWTLVIFSQAQSVPPEPAHNFFWLAYHELSALLHGFQAGSCRTIAAALRMYQGKKAHSLIWVMYKRKVCERAWGRRSRPGNRNLSENMCKSVGGSDRGRSLETRSQDSIMDDNYFTLELWLTQLERLESAAIRQAVYWLPINSWNKFTLIQIHTQILT